MQWAVVAVVVASVAVSWGQDECAPPSRGEKHVHPDECCSKLTAVLPQTFWTKGQTCMSKYPRPPRPSGPPPSGVMPTPSTEMKNSHVCMSECVFTENGLLTADMKLDSAAITTTFSSTEDADMKPVVIAAVTKCLGTYQNEIDTSLKCTSGAAEFKRCVGREAFLNCPSSGYTAGAECDALKTKVAKCPMVPVHLGHHNFGPRMGKGPQQ